MHQTIDLLLGAAFIVFYSQHRFNTPATNRSSTTAVRYYAALSLYCLAGLVFYLVLVHCPQWLTFVSAGDPGVVPDWAKGLATPLLVTLLLTVLLPKLPLLSQIDEWICKQLQHMAAIPSEVRRLTAELRRSPFRIAPEDREQVRDRLVKSGFNAGDALFSPGQVPAEAWMRLCVLFARIEEWQEDRKMSAYLETTSGELERLAKRHQQLIQKAKICVKLLRESSDGTSASRANDAVASYQQDFIEHINQLECDLLDFISRGVLYSELTDSARMNRLAALGFTVALPSQRFTLNQMLLLFGVLCILMTSALVFLSPSQDTPFGVLLTRSIMISTTYCIAVGSAVLPKERWKFAQRDSGQFPPVLFYLVAGLMAVGLSACVCLAFNCFLERGLESGWRRYLVTYPWLLVIFGTTVVTAALLDRPRHVRLSRQGQRMWEATMTTGLLLGLACLAHYWLEQSHARASLIPGALPFGYRVPPLGFMLVVSGAIGFVIGFCVPTWYREAPRAGVVGELPATAGKHAALPTAGLEPSVIPSP